MMSNVSHELRTPLNSILSCSSIIKRTTDSISRQLSKRTASEIKEDLDKVRKQARNCEISAQLLNHFVLDIIDLNRFENGSFELKPTET